MRRFGTWRQVSHGLKKFAERNRPARNGKRDPALRNKWRITEEKPNFALPKAGAQHSGARVKIPSNYINMSLPSPCYTCFG